MRAIFTLNLLFFFSIHSTSGQLDGPCGTESTERYLEQLIEHREQISSHVVLPVRSVKQYPVSAYIMRHSDGSGGMTTSEFQSIFSELNTQLAPAGISLFVCDSIHYIDSDNFYDFNKVLETTLTSQYYTDQTLNLYFPNSVVTGGGNILCGYAYFPGWQDVVVVDRFCALDGSSLAHEVGHYFGLVHTHGLSSVMPTDELANFSNCLSAGDDVCDTPAEPNLSSEVDSNCIYIGSGVDNNGVPFDPYPFNIMSYAPKPCRTQLTPGQYQRMSYIATYLRDYLDCPTLSADFTVADPFAVCVDHLTTTLSYSGIGATTYAWDINGDGITDYDSSTITHAFAGQGSHAVCLTVTNGQDTVMNCATNAITILDFASLPYSDDFNTAAYGMMVNPDMHHGWTLADIGPNFGNQCLVIDNYHYNTYDQEDYYIIGPFDMSTIAVPVLLYDIAYAPFSDDRWDAFSVEVSTDCGLSYQQLTYESGLDLSTIGSYMPYQWMPADSVQWRNEQISLAAYHNDTVLVRFTNITGFGNNLYIDHIGVQQDPLLAFEFLSFDVFRNPAGGHVLTWETADERLVTEYAIEISDDGIHFSVLDRVPGQSANHNLYQHTNHDAPVTAYYRIRGRLSDGTATLSPLRQISSRHSSTIIYPNPAHDLVHVQLSALHSEMRLAVYNAMGLQVNVQISCGDHSLHTIDVGDLKAGIYTIIADEFVGRFLKID